MLPTAVAKYFCRELSRRSTDFKHINSLCARIVRQELFNRNVNNRRFFVTSKYFYGSSEPKDKKNEDQSPDKVISQSATGDIVVKTETNADKVVTKVTIEKIQPVPESAITPPGTYAKLNI